MKSISVKVNDSVQTIAQTKVVTKDGQPTVIKATRNANYELINDATGYAPDHIVTKRVGKDLHISFEDDAKESDLIIKDFYDYDKSALIGQAESGQYHYYVPDTGLTQDYVTELVIGDIEGQALGGQGYPAPWWIGAEEGSRFGVMPWLVGIAGLAGIAAVVSGRDDKGNNNNNNANASAQEKPLNIKNIQSDTVAQGATQALNFTVTSNGQNVSQAIISVNGTELKDANNKTVLTDKDGKVNITAQLLEANGIKLGELPNFTISAKKEHYAQATATLHNPEVVTMDGGVVVTPHESATELEVTYTKPGQTVSTTAKFTHKDTNGDGKADAWIDNNKDDSVTIDPATGKVVIPVNTIGSKTNVTATQTTDVGTTNNSKGVSDILSAKPVVEAIKTGDDAGNVVIKPSDDAINGSKVVVSYTDADGKQNTATIAKDKGAWTADASLPKGVSLDKDKGTVTISSDNVTDGSDVSATQTDPGREESVPASDRAKTSVPQPKINANDDGSVTVTPSDKANKVTINYTDEDGKQNTATIAKDNNGKWTSNDDKVVIGNDGSITIPADKVKDGSKVTAQQTTSVGISNPVNTTAKDSIAEPEVTADKNGSVTVKPAKDATKVEISYVDEDNKEQTVTANKDNNGKWTSNNDKVVIGNDGTITIPSDKVKDGSDVTANQTTNNGKSGDSSATVAYEPDTTPPKVKGDPTVDGAGTTLTVPFNEPLDDKNPPAKENFTVTVDDKPVKPTAVTVDGDKVKLTLPTPAKQGDKVSVSYTDPTAANDVKAVQDKAGNDAASFTNTPVTNGSTVTTPSKLSITTKQTEIVEGDKGGTVTFKVTRTEGTGKASVKWALTGTVDNSATVTGKDSDFANDQPTSGMLTFAPGETEKIIEVKIKDDTVVEKTEGFTVTLSDAKGATITTDSASSVIKNDDKLVVGLAKDSYSERPQVGSDNDQYTNNPKINISNIPEGVEWEYRLNNGKWEKGEKPNDEGTGTFDLKPAPDVWQGVSYKIEARVKSKDYDSNSTLGSLDMTLDQSVRAPIITGVKSGNQITGIAEANSFVYIDKDGSGTYTRGDVGTVADNKGEFTLPFGEKLKETGRDGPLIFSRQNKDTPLASLGVIDEAGNALSKKDMSHFFYFDSLDGYDYFSTATSKTGTTAASTTKLQDIPHTVYVNNVISAGTFNFGSADDVLVQNGGYLQNNSYINMGAGDDYAKFNYIRQAGYGSVDMGSGNDILEVGLVGNSSFTGSTIKLGEGDDVVRGGSVGGVRGSLDGGKGYDFWDMTGSGIKHDLNNISGMEVINLGGRKNVLQVKISDVVKNADTATLIDGQSYQGLFINGNGQDKVDLGANGSPRRGDKLGGFVKDIREGKAPEGYDAYWDGNNENTHVFIQKGIEVI